MAEILSAPVVVEFDYTRSLGPVMQRFFASLRDGRLEGVRGSDGRVHCPPPEFDPVTAAALEDFVEVGPGGEVVTWAWMAEPLAGQPLDRPFAWALIRLDGADTPMLHALDVADPAGVTTGMRVRARLATEPVGGMKDLVCFEPEGAPAR